MNTPGSPSVNLGWGGGLGEGTNKYAVAIATVCAKSFSVRGMRPFKGHLT